jgi:hypothetical protein
MRIDITTCVIKPAELEFLKLDRFCAILPPDVSNNQEEKPVLSEVYGHVHLVAVLCSL